MVCCRIKEKSALILKAQSELRKSFEHSPYVKVVTRNPAPVFSFVGTKFNGIAIVKHLLKKHQWCLSMTQNPPGGQISITDSTSRHWESLRNALNDVFEDFNKNPALNE